MRLMAEGHCLIPLDHEEGVNEEKSLPQRFSVNLTRAEHLQSMGKNILGLEEVDVLFTLLPVIKIL